MGAAPVVATANPASPLPSFQTPVKVVYHKTTGCVNIAKGSTATIFTHHNRADINARNKTDGPTSTAEDKSSTPGRKIPTA
jgi:hypothetical protein